MMHFKKVRKNFFFYFCMDFECEINNNNKIRLISTRGVQEPESDPEQEPELSKFFRSRIGLGVKFNVKTGVGVGAGVTIF